MYLMKISNLYDNRTIINTTTIILLIPLSRKYTRIFPALLKKLQGKSIKKMTPPQRTDYIQKSTKKTISC